MPYNTESFVEYQEREIEGRKASLIPEGRYNLIVEEAGVTDVNGTPRLMIRHRVEGTNNPKTLDRIHNEFINWYASENTVSDKPVEERQRGLRGFMTRKLDCYHKAMATCPTSTQELGESFNDALEGLRRADDVEEVTALLEAIGSLLVGQFVTGRISHSNNGWANLMAEAFDPTIGAHQAVTV